MMMKDNVRRLVPLSAVARWRQRGFIECGQGESGLPLSPAPTMVPEPASTQADAVDVNALTGAQLRERLAEWGVPFRTRELKAALVEKVKEYISLSGKVQN